MTKILLLISSVTLSLQAFGNPLYEVTADETTACTLNQPHECRTFKHGYQFGSLNWGGHAPIIGGSTLPPPDGKGEREVYDFQSKDVAPILDAQGNMTEPACKWPIGGMMQHTVVGPNGQLYLKRVEVVTKCVNGKMTTIQRALN